MKNSRRSFLRASVLTALTVGLLRGPLESAFGQNLRRHDPTQDFQIPSEVRGERVYHFTKETFEPYVGGVFGGRGQGRAVTLTLLAVSGYEQGPQRVTQRARKTSSFALSFRASSPLSEITTIHTLTHGALGEFSLFLTRRDDERGQIFYEAVFNHPRP